MTQAYPLTWPDGWSRARAGQKQDSKYKFRKQRWNSSQSPFWTFAEARDALMDDMYRQWAGRRAYVTLDGELLNVIPAWWVDLGLPARWWCFWQDVFNFRNPWRT